MAIINQSAKKQFRSLPFFVASCSRAICCFFGWNGNRIKLMQYFDSIPAPEGGNSLKLKKFLAPPALELELEFIYTTSHPLRARRKSALFESTASRNSIAWILQLNNWTEAGRERRRSKIYTINRDWRLEFQVKVFFCAHSASSSSSRFRIIS